MKSQAWVIARPSRGTYSPDCLRLEERELPAVQDGELRLRNVYLSLDPTSRNWLKLDPASTYFPLAVGDVMVGVVLSVVEESRAQGYAPGDAVGGMLGWETHSVVPAARIWKLDTTVPLETHLTIFSHIGRAAAIGMLEVAALRAGDVTVVSGAAGATGLLAAQIALAYGAKVVGIAGGERKCRMLTRDYGLQHAIDYRAGNLTEALCRCCPEGVDVFFDNVGGEALDAVLGNLAIGARIAICGAVSQYDLPDSDARYGVRNLPLLMFRRARMEGFVVPQFESRYAEFDAVLARLFREGKLASRAHVVTGLAAAPEALGLLFNGGNDGKLMVKLSEPG